MSWREERDALIAQTMAFVQSVTGKPADFAQFPLSFDSSEPKLSELKSSETEPSEPALSTPDSVQAVAVPAAKSAVKDQEAAFAELAALASPHSVADQANHRPPSPLRPLLSSSAPSAPVLNPSPAAAPAVGAPITVDPTSAAKPIVAKSAQYAPDRSDPAVPPSQSVSETERFAPAQFGSITSQLGLQRDMQTEIKARVASFRAHQERFNRERQEYFSTTLARLRESMDGVSRTDK